MNVLVSNGDVTMLLYSLMSLSKAQPERRLRRRAIVRCDQRIPVSYGMVDLLELAVDFGRAKEPRELQY